nr:YabP/YqfC family sporulation protein [Neglectibacter timonensis]
MTGNRRAVVDGCDGIVDYDEEKVIVRTGRLTVRFEGRSLRLKRLTENSAVIEGFIIRVEYQY